MGFFARLPDLQLEYIYTYPPICASVIDFPVVKFYSHPRFLFIAALAHLFCVLSFWRVPSANKGHPSRVVAGGTLPVQILIVIKMIN